MNTPTTAEAAQPARATSPPFDAAAEAARFCAERGDRSTRRRLSWLRAMRGELELIDAGQVGLYPGGLRATWDFYVAAGGTLAELYGVEE